MKIKNSFIGNTILLMMIILLLMNGYILYHLFTNFKVVQFPWGSNYKISENIGNWLVHIDYRESTAYRLGGNPKQINNAISTFYNNKKFVYDKRITQILKIDKFHQLKLEYSVDSIKIPDKIPAYNAFCSVNYYVFYMNIYEYADKNQIKNNLKNNSTIPSMLLLLKPLKTDKKVYVIKKDFYIYFIPESEYKKLI
jgi:hypothetical protein